MMKQFLLFLKDHTTLILTLTSAYIYFCIYSYEKAYLKAFNIPAMYISIDISTILLDTTYVISMIILTFGTLVAANRIGNNLKMKSPKLAYLFIVTFFVVALFILQIKVIGISQVLKSYRFYIYGGVELIAVVIVFIINPKLKTPSGDVNQPPMTETEILGLLSSIKWYAAAMLFLFAFFLVDSIAQGEASLQTTYQVLDSTNTIVVRKYGDQLICVDYDTTKKVIGKKVILIKIFANKPLTFTSKNLGRLVDYNGQMASYKTDSLSAKLVRQKKELKKPTLKK